MRYAKTRVLGPVTTPDGVLTLRSPQLRDATAWSRARLANRQWLERAFPAWGDDWAAEQSEIAWVGRWWTLRRAMGQGRAKPFVMLLDGELIGEVGVDAVDEFTDSGEASVWMVRDHGSPAVMNAASLLLIEHAFTDRDPIDRMISPVATTSRKGRTPGLTAVGFTIEATVPRKVGDKGYLDHDIWVVPNNPTNRATISALAADLPTGSVPPPFRTTPAEAGAVARAAARLLVRELRARVRSRLRPDASSASWSTDTTAGTVTVRPSSATTGRAGLTGYDIEHDQRAIGAVDVKDDPGTGLVEIAARVRPGTEGSVLAGALELVLAAVAGGAFRASRPAVRVPQDAADGTVPDAAMLAALGLGLVANFPANPDGPRRWAGEQRFEPPAEAPTSGAQP